ncbi:MAG: LAGLIDADG family homing endonuclease [Candidatus Micrarchaeota archaeon]
MNERDVYWWLGVTHADGYFYFKNNKVRELRLRVSICSLSMLKKWGKIIDKLTEKKHRLLLEKMYDPRSERKFDQYLVREGSQASLSLLNSLFLKKKIKLTSIVVPDCCYHSNVRSGAYLAGIIDGDGCIQLRKHYVDGHLERLLKITTNNKKHLEQIQSLLRSVGLSSGYITDYVRHFDLWVYLNKKSIGWFKKYVVQNLAIKRKAFRFK